MRVLAVLLCSSWLLGAGPAHAGKPAPALLEAEALLEQASRAGQTAEAPFDPIDPSARAVAVTDVERVLRALLARCLAENKACKELNGFEKPESEEMERVVKSAQVLTWMLGQYGTTDVLPLLWQLDARGSFDAMRARDALQTRVMTGVLASRPCAPPSDEEVSRELASLGDFTALRVRGGKLVAVRPTPKELEDLAYFLVAVREAGPPVGEVQEPGGDWRSPAPANDTLDAAYKELSAARFRGDLQAMDTAARRYLGLLGYPGPLKANEENTYGWHGSRYASVMRELARVQEDVGAFAEAAALNRRASPGDGACGTGVDLVLKDQILAVIRTTEQHSGCRAVVAERLLDMDGELQSEDDPSPYGPARLREAGFDVARLYRGALVTRHRDIPVGELKQVLSSAKEPLRTAALRRLQERGPEAWEKRVQALEGFAAVVQREAVEPLLTLALTSLGGTQHRAVEALGRLVERPGFDPCSGEGGVSGSVIGSSWRRYIPKIGERCATSLKPRERDSVARRLLPLLESKDGRTREVTAEALGLLGSELAVPRLEQLATDGYISGAYFSGSGNADVPRYPVREAAAKALERFKPDEEQSE
ncbi:hypothetical protein JY651_26245 [Pyxidicoccus parkwayensis]|uniref:HEAT repeat domain-containing protein n=1 Tax=Pyxidicoccus parkwayensis TaxID=2813578 RepID=A0ABX7NK82_9BACT|nr:hypothetical protein [Pyxidicoccus parkwaysis]QSQ18861.1 hypothetical protein JY651_26245 [Pyxidicoccus parkwaysis]